MDSNLPDGFYIRGKARPCWSGLRHNARRYRGYADVGYRFRLGAGRWCIGWHDIPCEVRDGMATFNEEWLRGLAKFKAKWSAGKDRAGVDAKTV